MNMELIQKIKKRFAVQSIKEALLSVMQRFPIGLVFLAAVTILLSYRVTAKDTMSPEECCLLYFLTIGILIDFAVSLWGEEQRNKRKQIIVEGVLLGIWAVYCTGIYVAFSVYKITPSPDFFIGNAAWITAIVFLIPFIAFWQEKEDLKAWHFLVSLFIAGFISGLVSSVMSGGIDGLYAGAAALFEFALNETIATIITITCMVFLAGLLFFALVPKGERKHNTTATMPPALRKILTWLLLPLLACYIIVLYAYGLSILIHWELPKGLLSWLVSAIMAGWMICYVLLYPEIVHKESWICKVMSFWMPIILLPLLVLMSVGVARRLLDYGITPMRLYLLTILLWFYAICIVMIVSKKKRFRWIFLSFIGLFILSSGQPFNYYRICRPNLTAKIEKIIAEKELQTPFKLSELDTFSTLSEEEARALREDLEYMRRIYGQAYTEKWIEEEESRYVNKDEKREEVWVIHYYRRGSNYTVPDEYDRFNWTNRSNDSIPTDSLYDGKVHVRHQDALLVFDTAAIRLANDRHEMIIIPSANHKGAVSLTGATITGYKNDKIDLEYSGYFFYNQE